MAQQLDLELDHDLDDWEASESVREALLERFGEWMVAGERSGAEWPVAEALRFKADYLDGQLGTWRCVDVAEILTMLFPRKVSADEANVALVVPTLRAFFTWMDEAGLLHPGSDPVPALHDELDRIEPELPTLMFDESRYGPGKTVTAAMLADGVDLDDPDAVQAWIDGYNRRLGERHLPRPSLPPVSLPDDEILAELAAAAPAMVQLRALLGWVGRGRRLTATERLRLRDAAALSRALDACEVPPEASPGRAARLGAAEFLFEWALASGVLDIEDRVAVPGPGSGPLADARLDAWLDALVALLTLGAATAEPVRGPVPACAERLNEAAGPFLVELQACGSLPLAELARRAHGDRDETGVPSRSASCSAAATDDVPGCVSRFVHRLAQLYAIDVTHGQVRLGTLGVWFVCRLAEQAGADVPLVPDLSHADPAAMLATCAAWAPDEAAAGIEGWIASRGAAMAAEQLAMLAEQTTAPDMRARAFAALGCVGVAAEAAVRRLEEGSVCQAEAHAWLVEQGLEEPEPLDPACSPELFVAQLAGLIARGGDQCVVDRLAAAVPAEEQPRVVEALWRVDHPSVPVILEAVGKHGCKPVAKAARKALFKHRTASRH